MNKVRIQVIGPFMTTHGGELRESVEVCADSERRCQHFNTHDWHYFYCSAQTVPNQTYPWPGAGKQLRTYKPDAGCPFNGKEAA